MEGAVATHTRLQNWRQTATQGNAPQRCADQAQPGTPTPPARAQPAAVTRASKMPWTNSLGLPVANNQRLMLSYSGASRLNAAPMRMPLKSAR
eukprot:11132314-Alexandrium_andersonii.AAC.1